MLGNRTAGRAATFTLPLVDASGVTINATAAGWTLLNERGVPLATGEASLFHEGDIDVTIEIAASDMSLPSSVTSQGREIVVTLVTSMGDVELRDYFILVAAQPLQLLVNSFITYPEALSFRQGFGPVLDGWDATPDRDQRCSALADAHERLLRLAYRVPSLDPMVHASSYAAYGTGTDVPFGTTRRVNLRGMGLEALDQLPANFTRSLKRAQLTEADIILGGDAVGRKRQEGIISETIGESSAFFNSKPYLNLPVHRRTFDELRRFVVFDIRVARG